MVSPESNAVVIDGFSVLSAVGSEFSTSKRLVSPNFAEVEGMSAGVLSQNLQLELNKLAKENPTYDRLDRSTLMAILTARKSVENGGWDLKDVEIGINIGTARGATGLFEHFHSEFLNNQPLSPFASPTTTAGNISSWAGYDLQTDGPVFTHSATCGSAGFAIANAVAWLRSGMATHFLAGGSEAPLTPFTFAQMKAVKVYSPVVGAAFPCQPFASEPYNSMVLGEGAALFALTTNTLAKNPIARIAGIGWGSERAPSPTGISSDGKCLQNAMKMALKQAQKPVDLIVAHAPGTIKGDAAELLAIEKTFNGLPVPFIYSTKWQTGHAFGASMAISLAFALEVFMQNLSPEFPYPTRINVGKNPSKPHNIMINAVGFGGNAVSIIVEKI